MQFFSLHFTIELCDEKEREKKTCAIPMYSSHSGS